MSGIVVERQFWDTPYQRNMPQTYLNNYDMNVAPIAGIERWWQVKFNPRAYNNLVTR